MPSKSTVEQQLAEAIKRKQSLVDLQRKTDKEIEALATQLASFDLRETSEKAPSYKSGDKVRRLKGTAKDRAATGIVLYTKGDKVRIRFSDREYESTIVASNLKHVDAANN